LFVSFDTVRREALLALYRLTYSSDEQEYFTRDEIAEKSEVSVGAVFFSRVLLGLASEELVISNSYDESGTYYSLTNAGWASAERIALSMLKSGEPVEGVPASDRVVTLSDNQHATFEEALDDLSSELEKSNEVGDVLGDSRPRIQAEISAGRRLILPKFVRLDAIVAVLVTPLRYLVEKFSGAAVGEIAKKLLDLLWKMINS
jgi:hypothetical protein